MSKSIRVRLNEDVSEYLLSMSERYGFDSASSCVNALIYRFQQLEQRGLNAPIKASEENMPAM